MKRSSAPGALTSRDFEVLALTPHALWISIRGQELMLDYARFPWFRGATIEDVQRCELRFKHLYWPRLDVDLHLDSLAEPDRFPLVARASKRSTSAGRAKHAKTAATGRSPSVA